MQNSRKYSDNVLAFGIMINFVVFVYGIVAFCNERWTGKSLSLILKRNPKILAKPWKTTPSISFLWVHDHLHSTSIPFTYNISVYLSQSSMRRARAFARASIFHSCRKTCEQLFKFSSGRRVTHADWAFRSSNEQNLTERDTSARVNVSSRSVDVLSSRYKSSYLDRKHVSYGFGFHF